jgi:hypothetical protein
MGVIYKGFSRHIRPELAPWGQGGFHFSGGGPRLLNLIDWKSRWYQYLETLRGGLAALVRLV